MIPTDVPVSVDGTALACWHFRATTDDLRGPAGRPCVVMAHGFGATRDSGLTEFAQNLAASGADVLVFDYRGFGSSGGQFRQLISVRMQLDDYRAAIDTARTLEDVDPDRVVVWGVSFSGGLVIDLGAEDRRLAAVIALTPTPDALAAIASAIRRHGPGGPLRAALAGLSDAFRHLIRRRPHFIPIAGVTGSGAVLTARHALEDYTSIAGPTWRNEIPARSLLQVGTYRAVRHAKKVTCPVLIQVADMDRTAPPRAAMVAARRSRAEVRHYPCDHFDVYPGKEWHSVVCRHQRGFLTRVFAEVPAGSADRSMVAQAKDGTLSPPTVN